MVVCTILLRLSYVGCVYAGRGCVSVSVRAIDIVLLIVYMFLVYLLISSSRTYWLYNLSAFHAYNITVLFMLNKYLQSLKL